MIKIYSNQFSYSKETKTFKVDGRAVQFDSSYELVNSKTGNSMKFNFDHSDGSEWDPKTIWFYKSKEGFTLEVGNEDVTPAHAEAYLNAKLGIKPVEISINLKGNPAFDLMM